MVSVIVILFVEFDVLNWSYNNYYSPLVMTIFSESISNAGKIASEAVDNIRTISAFNAAYEFLNRFVILVHRKEILFAYLHDLDMKTW